MMSLAGAASAGVVPEDEITHGRGPWVSLVIYSRVGDAVKFARLR
jgi:hypothetical protein